MTNEFNSELNIAPYDPSKSARRTFSRIGFALLATALIMNVLQIAMAVASTALANAGVAFVNERWFFWVSNFLPLYAVAIPAGILIMGKAPKEQPEKVKFGGKKFFAFLLICFPTMYAGNLIGTFLSYILSAGKAENAVTELAFDNHPLKIIVVVIVAPILEEFLFRKQIIDRCAKFGEKSAILFSALTFGLFHMNFFQFFYAFALGLVFAYVYTRTRRLRYSIIMHMVINFMGSVAAPYVLSLLDPKKLSAGVDDPAVMIAMLPALIIMMLYMSVLGGLNISGIVMFILNVRRLVFEPATDEIPKGKGFKSVYVNAGIIIFVVFCLAICVLNLLPRK